PEPPFVPSGDEYAYASGPAPTSLGTCQLGSEIVPVYAPLPASKRSTPWFTGTHAAPPPATIGPMGTTPGGNGFDDTEPSAPIRFTRYRGVATLSASWVTTQRAPSPSASERISPWSSTASTTWPLESMRTTRDGGTFQPVPSRSYAATSMSAPDRS